MLQVSTDIFDIQQTVAITAAVRELVLQRPCLPELCRKPLSDFVEDFLARSVFQQWFSSRKERRSLDLPDRPPEDLLLLYHAALQHLQEVIRDPELLEVSWAAPELCPEARDWNCP